MRSSSAADGGLHLGHAVVPAHHVVDVGQLLLKFQQAQPLLDVIAVIAEAARPPGQVLVVVSPCRPRRGGEGLVLAETAPGHVAQAPVFLPL